MLKRGYRAIITMVIYSMSKADLLQLTNEKLRHRIIELNAALKSDPISSNRAQIPNAITAAEVTLYFREFRFRFTAGPGASSEAQKLSDSEAISMNHEP